MRYSCTKLRGFDRLGSGFVFLRAQATALVKYDGAATGDV